jgi:hypothetical protein
MISERVHGPDYGIMIGRVEKPIVTAKHTFRKHHGAQT